MQKLTEISKTLLTLEDEIRIATKAQRAIHREIEAHRKRDEDLGFDNLSTTLNYRF